MIRFLLFFLCLFLSACSNGNGLNLGRYPDPGASPDKFIVCHGYGCSKKTYMAFNKQQWASVKRVFRKKPKTAKVERQKIAEAISLIEKYVGEAVGTKDDLPKAPIIRASYKEQDCIDETVNTTKYLNFLKSEELLVWHDVGRPAHKGHFINGVYPHNSATIQETETGQVFVVDSYIFKNGEKPVIRTLEDWLAYKTFESEEF